MTEKWITWVEVTWGGHFQREPKSDFRVLPPSGTTPPGRCAGDGVYPGWQLA